LKKELQKAIDRNREVLTSALLPSIAKNPPARWTRFLGEHPRDQKVEQMLRTELMAAFGNSDGVFRDMNVKAIFKGVTYESLSDPEFMRIAGQAIPLLETRYHYHVKLATQRRTQQGWCRNILYSPFFLLFTLGRELVATVVARVSYRQKCDAGWRKS
jgi:hypothetical protein